MKELEEKLDNAFYRRIEKINKQFNEFLC